MALRARQSKKDLHRSPRTKWELAWFLVMKWPLGDLNLQHGLSILSPESNQALDFFFLIFIYVAVSGLSSMRDLPLRCTTLHLRLTGSVVVTPKHLRAGLVALWHVGS